MCWNTWLGLHQNLFQRVTTVVKGASWACSYRLVLCWPPVRVGASSLSVWGINHDFGVLVPWAQFPTMQLNSACCSLAWRYRGSSQCSVHGDPLQAASPVFPTAHVLLDSLGNDLPSSGTSLPCPAHKHRGAFLGPDGLTGSCCPGLWPPGQS